MAVESWEEEHRLEQDRRALWAKQEEERRLEAEKERKRLKEEERIRLAAEEVVRQAAEEVERLRRIEEEKDRVVAEENARIRRANEEQARLLRVEEEKKEQERRDAAAEKARLIAEEEEMERVRQVRLDDDDEDKDIHLVAVPPVIIPTSLSVPMTHVIYPPDIPQPSPPTGYLSTNSQPQLSAYHHSPQQQQQWNPNYYVPPPISPSSASNLISQVNNTPPNVNPTTTGQTNPPASSSINSFKKYYFPLLTSMADSRSLRDRQHQYSTDLNQPYGNQHQPPSGNQVSSSNQNNPYLSSCANANPPPPAIQHFPILGSLSHPQSNHMWPGETGIRSPMSFTTGHNPLLNGPLLGNDPSLLKTNGSRGPSPADLSTGSASNGSHPHHTLR